MPWSDGGCSFACLIDVCTALEPQGRSKVEYGLPQPLLGGDALQELKQHLTEYCLGMGVGAARRMQAGCTFLVPLNVKGGGEEFREILKSIAENEMLAGLIQTCVRMCVPIAGGLLARR